MHCVIRRGVDTADAGGHAYQCDAAVCLDRELHHGVVGGGCNWSTTRLSTQFVQLEVCGLGSWFGTRCCAVIRHMLHYVMARP